MVDLPESHRSPPLSLAGDFPFSLDLLRERSNGCLRRQCPRSADQPAKIRIPRISSSAAFPLSAFRQTMTTRASIWARPSAVRAFERILKGPNRLDVLTSSFLAGLLADQISPGSFEHVDLLLPYLNQYPTALIWYGLCAGLHPDSEVQQVGNCLGRRLVRDLLASDPILSRPKYDIAVRELEVHLDREEPLEFRTASQNHIAVRSSSLRFPGC